MPAQPQPEDVSDDTVEIHPDEEITQADGEWPVSKQYLVEPTGNGRPESAQAVTTVETGRRRRRLAPDLHPALLALLAALLVAIPVAVLLLARDEPAESARPAAATTDPVTTSDPTPTTTTTGEPRQVAVPDVEGMDVAEARAALEKADLRVRVRRLSSQEPEGEVLAQSPDGGTDVALSSLVMLTASGGPRDVEIPDVVGLTAAEATRALRQAGLRREAKPVTSDESPGTVLSQTPAAGKGAEPASVVRLRVAQAAPSVELSRLIGLTAADAKSRLRDLGLGWRVTDVTSEKPKGTVVGQSPGVGADLEKGETVILEVSSGAELVRVPDVVGEDEWLARPRLVRLGFEVIVVDEPTDDLAQDGIVVSQDAAAGQRLRKGSTVTLTVSRFS